MAANDVFRSREYSAFRSSVAQKKVTVSGVEWTYYEAGPKSVDSPIIFLPPICGTADIFYKQILSLSALQYRVMSVELPVVWEVETFCQLFGEFLNFLNFSKVHLFGASLGGFLGMKFAEFSSACPRVHSLILCNSFADTSFFNREHLASSFWLCPVKILRNIICKNIYSGGSDDMSIVRSVAFMLNRLNQLTQKQLASRLKLNCAESYVQPHLINNLPVTLLDVFDINALTDQVRDNLYKCFPESKKAHLKSGGNFPYLSRASDVNLHIQIHLREFLNSRYSARKGVPSDYAIKPERSPDKDDDAKVTQHENDVTPDTASSPASSDENQQLHVPTSLDALVSSVAVPGRDSGANEFNDFNNQSLPILAAQFSTSPPEPDYEDDE